MLIEISAISCPPIDPLNRQLAVSVNNNTYNPLTSSHILSLHLKTHHRYTIALTHTHEQTTHTHTHIIRTYTLLKKRFSDDIIIIISKIYK